MNKKQKRTLRIISIIGIAIAIILVAILVVLNSPHIINVDVVCWV